MKKVGRRIEKQKMKENPLTHGIYVGANIKLCVGIFQNPVPGSQSGRQGSQGGRHSHSSVTSPHLLGCPHRAVVQSLPISIQVCSPDGRTRIRRWVMTATEAWMLHNLAEETRGWEGQCNDTEKKKSGSWLFWSTGSQFHSFIRACGKVCVCVCVKGDNFLL